MHNDNSKNLGNQTAKEALQEQLNRLGNHKETCPNCGYCPHCGRSNWPPYIWYGTIPPYHPVWTTTYRSNS